MGRAWVPYTCGEWFQGTLDGVPCLVSCPIARGVEAEAVPGGEGIRAPRGAWKARRALDLACRRWGMPFPGLGLALRRSLPSGRGYGASTADLGAGLFALARLLGRPTEPLEVARIAVEVEPTDGSLFPGLALWDHRRGSFVHPLPAPPRVALVVLDPGGEVDTLAFNAQDLASLLRPLAPLHRSAFRALEEALKEGSPEGLGEASTLSARAHQQVLFSPLVERALELLPRLKAMGLVRAHSGTVVGLLVPPHRGREVARLCRGLFGPSVRVWTTRPVEGGPRFPPDPPGPALQGPRLPAS